MASVPPTDPRRDVLHPAADEPRDYGEPPEPQRQGRKRWRGVGASTVVLLVAAAVIVVLVIVL